MSPRNAKGAGATPQRPRPNVSTSTRPDDVPTITRLDDFRQLRAWASACHHLRSLGLAPLPPAHVVAALRKRGWWR